MSRSIVLAAVAGLAVGVIGSGSAAAAPGDLDPTFSGDGIANFQFASLSEASPGLEPAATGLLPVGVQAGGKVILYGGTQYSGGCSHTYCPPVRTTILARLNDDGSLDDFAGRPPEDGPIGDQKYGFADPVLDADGRLLFGGDSGGDTAAVLRLTVDGLPDPTFGDGGVATVKVPDATSMSATSIGLQSDGRIVVGANSEISNNAISQLDVFRLDKSGELDTTFGAGGIAHYEPGGFLASFWGIDVDGADRIVTTYATADWPGDQNRRVVVARLTADGQRDQTFGIGGGVGIPVTTTQLSAGALVDSKSRIYLPWPVDFPTGMKRLGADGFADPAYGPDGVHVFDGRGGGPILAATLQPDDRLIATAATGGDLMVGRRLEDGGADESFAPGGWVRTPSIAPGGTPVVASDGRIVVAGGGAPWGCVSVMRYVGDSAGGGAPTANQAFQCEPKCSLERSCRTSGRRSRFMWLVRARSAASCAWTPRDVSRRSTSL